MTTYREPAFVEGPELVVRVCKFCHKLMSEAHPPGSRGRDDLSNLQCDFDRLMEQTFGPA